MSAKEAATDATQTVTHAMVMQPAIAENVVYLMGTSFILGSLFTIFILILLDFMKRDRLNRDAK
jgi:hypothetical protein